MTDSKTETSNIEYSGTNTQQPRIPGVCRTHPPTLHRSLSRPSKVCTKNQETVKMPSQGRWTPVRYDRTVYEQQIYHYKNKSPNRRQALTSESDLYTAQATIGPILGSGCAKNMENQKQKEATDKTCLGNGSPQSVPPPPQPGPQSTTDVRLNPSQHSKLFRCMSVNEKEGELEESQGIQSTTKLVEDQREDESRWGSGYNARGINEIFKKMSSVKSRQEQNQASWRIDKITNQDF